MTTVQEQAREIICALEKFLTKEKWTQNRYIQDMDPTSDGQGCELWSSEIDPTGYEKAQVTVCEMGGFMQVVHQQTGQWIDPNEIETDGVKVWIPNGQQSPVADSDGYREPLGYYWGRNGFEDTLDRGYTPIPAVTVYPLTEEQESAILLAYETLREQARQRYIEKGGELLQRYDRFYVPNLNDASFTTYDDIQAVNAAACKVLREQVTQ